MFTLWPYGDEMGRAATGEVESVGRHIAREAVHGIVVD